MNQNATVLRLISGVLGATLLVSCSGSSKDTGSAQNAAPQSPAGLGANPPAESSVNEAASDVFALPSFSYDPVRSGTQDLAIGKNGTVTLDRLFFTDIPDRDRKLEYHRAVTSFARPGNKIWVIGEVDCEHPNDGNFDCPSWPGTPRTVYLKATFIAQVGSDGQLDKSFGKGGYVSFFNSFRLSTGAVYPYAYPEHFTLMGSTVTEKGDAYLAYQGYGMNYGSYSESQYKPSVCAFLALDSNGQPKAGFGDHGLIFYAKDGYNVTCSMPTARKNGKLVALVDTVPPLESKIPFSYSGGLIQFNPDGSIDTRFGEQGLVRFHESDGFPFFSEWPYRGLKQGFSLTIDQDGKAVVTDDGKFDSTGPREPLLHRFLVDGSVDRSFGSEGKVQVPFATKSSDGQAIEATEILQALSLPDGGYLAVGRSGIGNIDSEYQLIRLDQAGKLDTGFGVGGAAQFLRSEHLFHNPKVLLRPDRKIIIATHVDDAMWNCSMEARPHLLQLTSNGQVDPAFNHGAPVIGQKAVYHDNTTDVVMATDGSIFSLTVDGDFFDGTHTQDSSVFTTLQKFLP